ncbi:MAG: squalene--hopene cyclase [Planctomycetes bacterium]|nr:squalene--hopene cyclase [Planctomycetota bacterium]MCH9723914.1 squalene--hopene cyclase [Planctomycetota bacterium]MCH9778640.1 squalene--hopene cyclase [Planctomycetota bacterium]MCH9789392.1 squalene--hopene cyclase [Planctomycetota bacterium]MDF1745405.1 prenyltransferase/squalene oxidase repeat-containing protein [Gimesia sp.]
MSETVSYQRIQQAYQRARTELLSARTEAGYWEGELSTSALSTATAVMALEMIRRHRPQDDHTLDTTIAQGIHWLATHQNEDGGWGDTVKSISNISTSMLCHAVFHATKNTEKFAAIVVNAKQYIDRIGGVEAVIARYGKDKTFSVPILTHCALAGLVEWKTIPALPFELSCLPAQFYKTVRLPVVSYALPALIAIGQVRHHFCKPKNPILRLIRNVSIQKSLQKLISIQPSNGGFLEAAPLTSFVTMSLAGMGLVDHPVVQKGLQFLLDSVKPDGSWPIDTNLATWTTTLSVNAIEGTLSEFEKAPIRQWLLNQQYKEMHPYTSAEPGGWAWTDLPGGVPDADDTPGAILALLNLNSEEAEDQLSTELRTPIYNGVKWLLDLQNSNGGWPTFCKGWGTLPFDQSAADISAHVIRALQAWLNTEATDDETSLRKRATRAVERSFKYLASVQRVDGSWLPLWFGNQHIDNDENPVYGTARVLAAYATQEKQKSTQATQAVEFLKTVQNTDGGWGGAKGAPSSVEETALAVDVLLLIGLDPESTTIVKGLNWLLEQVESGTFTESTPIGFYFAKLWYFEQLYPIVFCVSALHRAEMVLKKCADANLRSSLEGEDYRIICAEEK